MKPKIKIQLGILLVINILHLLAFTFMPFSGGSIFTQGFFHAVLFRVYDPVNLPDSTLHFINILTSVIYFGSLLMGLSAPFVLKATDTRKVLWTILFTIVPFILIYLMKLIFPWR